MMKKGFARNGQIGSPKNSLYNNNCYVEPIVETYLSTSCHDTHISNNDT